MREGPLRYTIISVQWNRMDNVFEIFLLTLGASFIQRTTGFGFGIFIMTMLPYLMPSYGEATALSGLLAMTTSAVIAFRMRKAVTWRRLLPILAACIICSTIAIYALSSIQDEILRRILGIILALIAIYFAFFSHKISFPTRLPWQVAAGSLSGFMGGFFGMHGPPAVMYFISSEPDKDRYMAMIQTYFFITNAVMTIARGFNGYMTAVVGHCYLYCLAGIVVGILLGGLTFKYIPDRIFPYVVYAYIGISGVIIFFTA